jgi:hypothetical protein
MRECRFRWRGDDFRVRIYYSDWRFAGIAGSKINEPTTRRTGGDTIN